MYRLVQFPSKQRWQCTMPLKSSHVWKVICFLQQWSNVAFQRMISNQLTTSSQFVIFGRYFQHWSQVGIVISSQYKNSVVVWPTNLGFDLEDQQRSLFSMICNGEKDCNFVRYINTGLKLIGIEYYLLIRDHSVSLVFVFCRYNWPC